jgi:Flp pilus assembly pilin Flp
MLWRATKRFIASEDGMEMVEWSIVGVVFAVAAAVFWTELATRVDNALTSIEDTIDPGGSAP